MTRFILPAALAVGLAGCSDRLAVGTTYQLHTASNNPLPIMLRIDGDCVHYLNGGSVVFDGRGGYESTYDISQKCGDRVTPTPQLGTRGRLLVRNDTAFFSNDAGADAGFGTISADSLVVRGESHRLVYLRAR